MIRSAVKSKDSSPSPSRGSSLRGASASEAKRTILHLENDDWSDEEAALVEPEVSNEANNATTPAGPVQPLDMAAVAQLMKSTLRKRSPKGMFSFFSFGKSKKEKTARAGSETGLQDMFKAPSRSDSVLDIQGSMSQSSPAMSPSNSSSNISVLKGSPFRKKKGSFLRATPESSAPAPDDSRSLASSSPADLKKLGHRRSNSMADVKAMSGLEDDLNALLARKGAPVSQASGVRGNSLRSGLTKKELKDLEKREKRIQKEAKKDAKRLSKKSKKDKDLVKSHSSFNSLADPMQHRYTTDMQSLPEGFDPSALKSALTPLGLSQRMGSPTRQRSPSQGMTPSSSQEVIKINIATGEVMGEANGRGNAEPRQARNTSAGHLAGVDDDLDQNLGGVNEALLRALSSEHLAVAPTTKDKRQSFLNLQALASDLGSLNFDFGEGDLSLTGKPQAEESITVTVDMQRSASIGPGTETAGSEASSFYSNQSSLETDGRGENGDEDEFEDDRASSSSDFTDGSGLDRDDVSVASSAISASWASSLISSVDEAEVELNKKALENGVQVELVKRIGKGATGVVWYGLLDGRPVAVKQVELREVSQKRSLEVRQAIKREVQLMQSLNCVHVVRYFGMFASKAQQLLTLIMELVVGVSITALIVERSKLPERFAAFLVQQVLNGLIFLEENQILHRDLKPDNLLINSRGVVKMIDFGTAARLENQNCRRSTVGTPWYCAPEVIRCEEYSFPADIWSLGCTLIEFLSGKPPYDDLQDVACLFKMAEGNTPPLPPDISPECHQFLAACLSPSPSDRPSASKLLEHPWIVLNLKDRDSVAEEVGKIMTTILSNDESKPSK